MKSLNTLSIATLLLQLSTLGQSKWTVGDEIKTTSGAVKGHANKDYPEVSEYLGIPFAAPPTGPRRFLAPQNVAQSSSTIGAHSFGSDCPSSSLMANSNATLPSGKPRVSEDCLTLNVWTKPQTGEKKKAVLVWIYGGGFTSGATNIPIYHGNVFAEKQDVVVVTVNYRLNVFGFPAAPGIPDLNLGLLDLRKGVEWVRDNIEAFGGDPKRITIFGESAGSRAVDVYAYAWTKDPIVNGFISESGAAPFISGNKLKGDNWFNLSSRLGCGGQEKASTTVDCVRSKSMNEIVKAAMGGEGKQNILNTFTPVVDEKIYFSDYDKRSKAGNFIKRPILIGNNDNETATLTANLGYNCGSRFAAQVRKDQGIPSWRYRWMGVFPNQKRGDSGAYHSSEIQQVFGHPNVTASRIKATENQVAISSVMNTAWAKFAKDPEKGLVEYGWPMYDAKKPTLVLLAANNTGTASFALPEPYDKQCSMVENVVPK